MPRLPIEGLVEKKPYGRLKIAILLLVGAAIAFGIFVATRPKAKRLQKDASSESLPEVEREALKGISRKETATYPTWKGPHAHQGKGIRPSAFSAGIWKKIEAMDPQLRKWRHALHAHPELANRETWTSRYVAGVLGALKVELHKVPGSTGLVAAIRGRPGPVVVDLPVDVSTATVRRPVSSAMHLPGYKPRIQGHVRQIRIAAEAINNSQRPVIYCGGGVILSNASDELRELAVKANCPVTTTLLGLGAFDERHPLSLHMLGMHGSVYSNYAVDNADLLLAFGVRFDDRVTGKVSEFVKRGTIVHVDVDASEINKIKEAHIPVVSDVRHVLAELNRIVEPPDDLSEWHRKIAVWKRDEPFHYDRNFDGILPQHAIEELCRLTRDLDPIIATGVGQHQMWSAQFFKLRRPRRFLSSSGLGTMGFGLPAAMGAKVAHPDKLVVDIDGDGSLLMNVQELGTCYCEKIPVKVMLLNNQHLGMVVQWEDRFHAANRAHTYLGPIDHPEAVGKGVGIGPEERYPDFVTIAKGFGWPARSISKKSDLVDGLQELIESPGQFLLDIAVPYQEHVLPMIPSGMTVRELIRE